MNSVRSLNDLCARIVANSRNNPLRRLPETPADQRAFNILSGTDAAIFTANGVAAMTPLPGVTAVPTIIYGLARAAFGFIQAFGGCCSTDATPGKRSMMAGAALVAGASAAFVPVLGSKVNFALAAWSAAELAAASVVARTPARVEVT